jgi:hypothetical protein
VNLEEIILRKYRPFISWLVVATAIAHIVCFFPFSYLSLNILWTGFADLALLCIAVWLVFFTYRTIQAKGKPNKIRFVHMCFAFGFLVVLALHVFVA